MHLLSARRHQPSHRAGRAARAGRLPGARRRRRRCAALAARGVGARGGGAVDLQPRRALRRLRRRRAARATDLVRFLSEYHGVDRATIAPHVYDVADLDAARHLFRVAAGLDSLVVGEPQILGQVKDAHTVASDARTRRAGAQPAVPLRRSPSASACAPKPASASGAVSVSYAAVALAQQDLRRPARAAASLVVGAGEMGKLTALHMKSQGVQQITIVSRTMAHAARTAEAIGGASAAPWDELDAALGASRHRHHRDRRGGADPDQGAHRSGDAAAAQPAAVHHRHRHAARRRSRRPAKSSRSSSTTSTTCRRPCARTWRAAPAKSRAPRRSSTRRSSKFGAWLRSRGAIPTVVALRQRFEAIRRAELERLELQAVGAAARGARARRRDHAPDRREAAADADRAAQGAGRRRNASARTPRR